MQTTTTLIPARGIVEFLLHPMEERAYDIDGAREWDRHLPFEPVVVDEIGLLFTAHDYLGQVLSEDCWEDGSHFYRPHLDGPVTAAPRIRRFSSSPPPAPSA